MKHEHSEYYYLNASEAFQLYRRKLRISKVVFIILCLAILAMYFADILSFGWYFVVLFSVLFVFEIYAVNRFNVLENKVFFQDCAPAKMFDIITRLERLDKKQKGRNTLLLEKARCCFNLAERENEGWEYLQQVNFKKKIYHTEFIRLMLSTSYYAFAKDREGFDKAKQQAFTLDQHYSVKKHWQEAYEKAKLSICLKEYLWDEKYEDAKAALEKLMASQNAIVDQVLFSYHLATIHVKEGNAEAAKPLFQFVIDTGNELKVVGQAKALMEEVIFLIDV